MGRRGKFESLWFLVVLPSHLFFSCLLIQSFPTTSLGSTMSFSRDSQAPSSIPKITDLRLQLGYGDSQLERCRAFYNDVTAFRRKHCTSAGLSGTELLDWKSPEHQSALDQMVHIYLDRQGNGYHYWPPHDHFPSLTDLQYDQDRSLSVLLFTNLSSPLT